MTRTDGANGQDFSTLLNPLDLAGESGQTDAVRAEEQFLRAEKPDFSFERQARLRGLWPCAGADEAGRGPLAGPVVAAAVILDPDNIPEGIDDSKRLDAGRRQVVFEAIIASAISVSICSQSAESIDRSDIRKATLAAIRGAVNALAVCPGHVLIDGRDLPDGLVCKGEAIIGGDRICQSVAAASIVAKTIRDRMMILASSAHPDYGFCAHKGYASPAHRAAIALHGGQPRLHRFTFAPLRQAEFAFAAPESS